MTPAEFQATHVALVDAAKTVTRLDLSRFLHTLNFSDVCGMSDPVKAERLRRLARAAMTLRGELLAQIREEFGGVAEDAGLLDEELATLLAPVPARGDAA